MSLAKRQILSKEPCRASTRRGRVRLVRYDSLRGIVILLTVIVGVQFSRRKLKSHRSPAGFRRPWLELCMVPIQDFGVSHLAGIHVLPDLAHDDPRDMCNEAVHFC